MGALIQQVTGSLPTAQTTTTQSSTSTANKPPSGTRLDPAPSFLFYVEISGLVVGLFSEVSGLSLVRQYETITEGGVNNMLRELPGRVSFGHITLKRGLSVSRTLWDWMVTGSYDFKVKRVHLSIIQGAPGFNSAAASDTNLLSSSVAGFGKIKQWDVESAYPVKWELSTLATADITSVAIETLELAHNGISLGSDVGTALS
jgi:phage tail-like protein